MLSPTEPLDYELEAEECEDEDKINVIINTPESIANSVVSETMELQSKPSSSPPKTNSFAAILPHVHSETNTAQATPSVHINPMVWRSLAPATSSLSTAADQDDDDGDVDFDDFVPEYKRNDNREIVKCKLLKSRLDYIKRNEKNIPNNTTLLQMYVPKSAITIPMVYDDSGNVCYRYGPNWVFHTHKNDSSTIAYNKMIDTIQGRLIDCMLPRREQVFLLICPEEVKLHNDKSYMNRNINALSSIAVAHCSSTDKGKLVVHDIYVCHLLYEFISADSFYCVPAYKNMLDLIDVDYKAIYIDYSGLSVKDTFRTILQRSNLLPISFLFRPDIKIYEIKNILKTKIENSGCPLESNANNSTVLAKNHSFDEPCPYCCCISALTFIGTNPAIKKSNLQNNFLRFNREENVVSKLILYTICNDIKIFMYPHPRLYNFSGNEQQTLSSVRGTIVSHSKKDHDTFWSIYSNCSRDENDTKTLPFQRGKRKIELMKNDLMFEDVDDIADDTLDLFCEKNFYSKIHNFTQNKSQKRRRYSKRD